MNTELDNNKEIVEKRIYKSRNKLVMLDSDLAYLYGVETKRINEAVKNNIDKFPERYSWKLTDSESKIFLVENFDQKIERRGGKYKNPRVFTEQGTMMLATILKSKIATEVTIKIMDAFVMMKSYISKDLLNQKYINDLVLTDHFKIEKIENTLKSFNKEEKKNEIFFNGQIFDAYSKIYDILSKANKSIIIVDAYADITILNIIRKVKANVIIITKSNNLLTKQDIEKYNKQYNNLRVIFDNSFHDRYFIVDDIVLYHCGTSVNKIGYKTFSINIVEDKEILNALRNKINNIEK